MEEQRSVFGEDIHRPVTCEDLPLMPYLEQVINPFCTGIIGICYSWFLSGCCPWPRPRSFGISMNSELERTAEVVGARII